MSPNLVTLLSTVFLAVGIAMSALAARHVVRRRAFVRDSEVATGIIVALNENRDQDETSYFPSVRFSTAAGREVTFQSATADGRGIWKIGDQLPVRYRREQPTIAEIDSVAALWGLPLVLALLGGAFLFAGVGALVGWIPN